MTKLSDTQALILSAAAQRPERIALPLPESLRGGAAGIRCIRNDHNAGPTRGKAEAHTC